MMKATKDAATISEPPKAPAPAVNPANTTLTPTKAFSDGFDSVIDANGNQSIIKGIKIKFTNNAEWIDDTGGVIAPTREFLVVELAKVTQKWKDNLPAEQRILDPAEPFPDVERLNAEVPKSEWREKFGKLVGPWQNSIAIYLFDPKTLEGFTWPTSTAGGFRAVDELKGRVKRARMMQGDDIYPLVTLGDTHMNTAFGGRQRPQFKVVRFVTLGGGQGRPLLAEPKPQELNDKIPW
jgi:hypothetical protein